MFRHSPMVQKLAKLLHLDIETAARLFEIINFLIIVFAIGIPLFKIMPKMLKNRRETLTKSIEEARAVTVDAQARLSAVEANSRISAPRFKASALKSSRRAPETKPASRPPLKKSVDVSSQLPARKSSRSPHKLSALCANSPLTSLSSTPSSNSSSTKKLTAL